MGKINKLRVENVRIRNNKCLKDAAFFIQHLKENWEEIATAFEARSEDD